MIYHNKDIEKTILGSCMESKEVLVKILDKGVSEDDFYSTDNRNLFKSLVESYKTKNTTDVLIVIEIGAKHKVVPSYITSVLESTLRFGDIDALVNELLELKANRELINISRDIEAGKLKEEDDIKKRFDEIYLIKSKIGNDNTITTIDKVEIVDIYKAEKIPTGFRDIDSKILGFALGSLNIITGYNGNGKSTLINQMCIAESLSRGYKIFAYSPELTNSNFKAWLYPTIANDEHFFTSEYNGIKYKHIGDVGRHYIDKWIKDKLYLYTDDSITHDEKQLLIDMKRLAENKGVKVFVIDNLMKIELEGSYNNELLAQRHFVNRLKEFARKYGAVVHLVVHPRKPQGDNKKITKFDIAGSGDITNLADYVMSISRVTGEEKEESPELKDSVIKVMKDRIKGTGEFKACFNFNSERKRFYSSNYELNKNYGYVEDKNMIEVQMSVNPF